MQCNKTKKKANSDSYNRIKNEKHLKNEQKVGDAAAKKNRYKRRRDKYSMRISIYLLTTTPSSHTHRFHPLPLAIPTSYSPHPLATPIHSTHSPQLSSILLTLHKLKVWMTIVESGWNVWVWLVGVVRRRWVWLVGEGEIYGCGYWVWL